jgi:hypothetical protein
VNYVIAPACQSRLHVKFIVTLAVLFCVSAAHAITPQQSALIRKAGNTSVEVERYQHLVSLSKLADLDAQLRSDLELLLPAVDLWANERKHWSATGDSRRNRFLSGYLRAEWPPSIAAESPLYPIWAMYRGRSLIQQPIQSGNLQHNPELRAKYFGEGRRLLNIAKTAFPENQLVRLYLDETFPWPSLNPPDPNAPEWANLQRETLEKLAHIITWWIETRQAPDGQLGGGWGDDVEIWRTWAPVLIGFGDPVIIEGQTNIAEGLFALDRMAGGYTSYMTDVEHTGEDSGDTCTSMMHLRPNDPIWQERARKIFTLFRDLWSGRNDRGMLQFKSTYFTSSEVDTSSKRACDTVYHPRAVQPSLLYWQRSGDPEMTAFFSDWMRTWVASTATSERGKPSGIIPSAIHWPDGSIGGKGEDWWDPQNHREPTLYHWPSAMGMMTNTLLLTSYMTGDPSYLEPVRSMARARAKYLADPIENPEPGSEAWCASRMSIDQTLAKYRLLTGDREYDDLLMKDANGYVRYRLSGDRKHLIQGLKRSALAFRINRASYMEEVRWTDRQLSFNRNYANHFANPKLPTPSLSPLYGAVTGDFGDALYFPMNAVRWNTTSRNIAALVTESGKQNFGAELYHFGSEIRKMGAELYLLDKGTYEFILTNSADGSTEKQVLKVTGPRTQVSFEITPMRLYTIQLHKSH